MLFIMTEKKDFGSRMRFVREMRGLTQTEISAATNIDQAAICHYEAGRRCPSIENLRAIAKSLMVSADYLLGLSEKIGP